MAQLTLEVNGKPYAVGCEDGQEAHVRSLAEIIDARVREVAPDAGAMGETRLNLLGALMLADEVGSLKGRLAGALSRAELAEQTLERSEEKVARPTSRCGRCRPASRSSAIATLASTRPRGRSTAR